MLTVSGSVLNGTEYPNAVNGNTVTSFNPKVNGTVYSITVKNEKVTFGGNFTKVNTIDRENIARVINNAISSFRPVSNGIVYSIAHQSDGKIVVGGIFTSIGEETRNNIARLDDTTGAADSFNPNANGRVNSVTIQPDGKILAGGNFTSIGGQTRNRLARLSNDTPATTKIIVKTNTLTLKREGSAPRFDKVNFKKSTDNGATWTNLGTATNNSLSQRENNNEGNSEFEEYTLTGQAIPTGQNVLIRAEGSYRTGYLSGSEVIEDNTQTAYLLAPSAASVSVSGRVTVGNGAGLTNATVNITDQNGNTKTARTKDNLFELENILTN